MRAGKTPGGTESRFKMDTGLFDGLKFKTIIVLLLLLIVMYACMKSVYVCV